MLDHKQAVAAEEQKANFDAAVSKAFIEDDKAMIKANIGIKNYITYV